MTETVTASLRIPEEVKDYYAETGENFNAKASDVLMKFKEAEENLGVTTDVQDMEVVVLRTYLASLEKNLQSIKAERDKLENLIEERIDDGETTVVEVKLDFDNKNV